MFFIFYSLGGLFSELDGGCIISGWGCSVLSGSWSFGVFGLSLDFNLLWWSLGNNNFLFDDGWGSSGLGCSTSGGTDVGKGAWGKSEFVKFAHKRSHEGVGLLGSDETILVNIESIPSLLEVSLHVAWNLGALKFVSSLKDDTSGLWGS